MHQSTSNGQGNRPTAIIHPDSNGRHSGASGYTDQRNEVRLGAFIGLVCSQQAGVHINEA